MSTNGWPTTSTCRPTGLFATDAAIRLSFEPGHQVVDQHPDAALAGRAGSPRSCVGEVVDALEVLHDDALDAQVVAPHLLDELRVVPALDEDPAGPGHAGLRAPGTATEPDAVRAGAAWTRAGRAE